MPSLASDLRYALRALLGNRLVSLVAILTLALGIGATTAIFSVVNSLLLRPLPYRKPSDLVRITADFEKLGARDAGTSVAELFDYREQLHSVTDLTAVFPIDVNLTAVDEPERVEGLLTSGSYFELLGATAQLGRVYTADDEIPGIAELAVISDSLWRRRFSADPDVLGRKVRLDNDLYRIIGVMPPGFQHPGRGIAGEPEIWNPCGYRGTPFPPVPSRTRYVLNGVLARLAPGTTLPSARAELDAVAARLRAEHTADYPETAGWTPRVVPLQEDLVGDVRPAMVVLAMTTGFVLLIACANVASLLLARASAREKEIAIRRALGAGRARLVQLLLSEAGLLSLLGAGLGLAFAFRGLSTIERMLPLAARVSAVAIDARALAFTAGVAIAATLLSGLAPALQLTTQSLRGPRRPAQGALVVAQFALALVLLVGAGLFLLSFQALTRVEPGFDPTAVTSARIWLPQPNVPEDGPYFQHESRVAFFRQVLERVSALPGVESAGGVSRLPLTGSPLSVSFAIEGSRAPETGAVAEPLLATPGYFATLRIPLLAGRLFDERDTAETPGVAVVSATFARRYFPGEDPIGRRIRPPRPADAPWLEIVGVAGDVKQDGLEAPDAAQVYRSALQSSSLAMALVVRAASSSNLGESIRASVRSVDSDVPVYAIRSYEELLSKAAAPRRFSATLLALFAAVALGLSALGVYGATSCQVAQRTREIGIRVALGCDRRGILSWVLARSVRLAALGAALGFAGSLVVSRLVAALLFEVSPFDLVAYGGTVALLLLAALAASFLPARRALRVDPVVALRVE